MLLDSEALETPSMEDTIQETLNEITARERDEAGRFKAKEEVIEAEAIDPITPEAVPETTEAIPDAPVVTETVDQNQLQRLGLRKEEMAAFEKADPVLRAAMLRRSDEMHKGVDQYRETAQFGHQIYKAIQPYEATIRSQGLNADEAIGSLFAIEHKLRYGTPQEKQSQLATIAHNYGIDINGLLDGQTQVDPQVQQLQDQIAKLQQQQQSWFAQQQQTEHSTILEHINTFAQGKDYFEQVRPEVAALLQAGRAKDLQEAYDMAIWARPEIRNQLLVKQQAEAEEKKRLDAAAKVAAAKQAASVNVSTRGTSPSQSPVGTMEETILNTYRQLTG